MRNKVVNNAAWIIGGKITQSLLGLIVSMLTARYLGPSNFGKINYAASLVAFAVPIMQLGFNNILVQEFINHPSNEGKILGTTLLLNFLSSIICMIGVISFACIANHNDFETIIVCTLYSVQLICQSLELCIYWFQSKYMSKYTSIVSLISYMVVSLYKIFLLISGKNVYWFSISNALDFLLIGFMSLFLYKKMGGKKLEFSLKIGKRLFLRSKYYIVSSLMVTIFAQTDKIMINQMIDSSATGYYSSAIACAGLSGFIFSAIIDSMRPSIFEAQKISKVKCEKNIVRLYSIVIYLSLMQSLIMSIFSPLIINIMYGKSYSAAIPVLRLVVWYTTFSYIGSVRNIWILSENKQKYLWIINLSGALANVIMNAIFIPLFGIMGAAVASLLTQIFTNVIIGYIIKDLKVNNDLMMKSLNPKYIIEMLFILKNRS